MAVFLLDDATGIGSDDLDTFQAFVDLVVIANDDGIGMDDPVNGMQLITYNRTLNDQPQLRLDTLVNTDFTPDYGAGPQNVDIILIPALSTFVLDDGSVFTNNGTALPPNNSNLPGFDLNPTNNCLVIYDTQQSVCVARDGTNGDIDLSISNPVLLYHELSHAFRIVDNSLLELTFECDPSSPEENAAIVDENDLRTQIADRQGISPELRDPNIHCGDAGNNCDAGCCIIATLSSKSLTSFEVQSLRKVRDHFIRSTEVGFAFFEEFFEEYYSFSPQVCTLMAGIPHAGEQMLDGFISPLLDFWKIMIKRSTSDEASFDLGTEFISIHQNKENAINRFDQILYVFNYWLGKENDTMFNDESIDKLTTLLRERAWSKQHIQWALVRPVQIYSELLGLFLQGESQNRIGVRFNEALESWLPDFPIHHIWSSLSKDEVIREMNYCENILLKTDQIKSQFRANLLNQFKHITSIINVINKS